MCASGEDFWVQFLWLTRTVIGWALLLLLLLRGISSSILKR
jgi:hypothetical protein